MGDVTRESLINSGAGYLLITVADKAKDALGSQFLESPGDLSDDALGAIGKASGVDERVCSGIALKIRRKYNKSWSAISQDEWQDFCSQFPESADYLSAVISS